MSSTSGMKKVLVAVSGGVDSMVLLDLITKQHKYEVIVAHVDHGMRSESRDDAAFVAAQARRYGAAFVSKRIELGEMASEEVARSYRYEFLFAQASQLGATLATAHHRDDLIGSIAINLIRGTGWRGLAVMNRTGIIRPLLPMTKQQLYNYAISHRLEWVEDETNHDDRYLRNQMRASVISLPENIQERLMTMRDEQVELASQVAAELEALEKVSAGSRYFYTMIDDDAAEELLRHHISIATARRLQPLQIKRAVLAIKTAKPGTTYQAGEGVSLAFSHDRFIVDSHL